MCFCNLYVLSASFLLILIRYNFQLAGKFCIKHKKQILSLLGSNFLYKDGKLIIELNPVFYNLLEMQKSIKNSIDRVRQSGR